MSKLTKAVWEGRSSDDPYVRLWIRTLESDADPGRLARGRVYYAAGNVAQIQVDPGTVRGRVSGSRNAPYQVSIRVNECSEYEWKAVWRLHRRLHEAVASSRVGPQALRFWQLPYPASIDLASLDIRRCKRRLSSGSERRVRVPTMKSCASTWSRCGMSSARDCATTLRSSSRSLAGPRRTGLAL